MITHNSGFRSNPHSHKSDIMQLVSHYRGSLLVVAAMSCVINILVLTGSIFMLEIYDRVLPSRSVPTLVGLIVILVVLMSFHGALEYVRTRVLVRIGAAFDESFAPSAHRIVLAMSLRSMKFDEGGQAVLDLDQVRNFVGSAGLASLFDLPWIPIYVGVCFMLHFWMGYAALAGAGVLILISILTELLTREPAKAVTLLGAKRQSMLENARRNSEVLTGMGFAGRFTEIWAQTSTRYVDETIRLVDRSAFVATLSRSFRQLLQSLVLALGAYLVIRQEISPGSIIAGSIIAARALAPIEQPIANWRNFVNTRESLKRVKQILALAPQEGEQMQLPAPVASLTVENVSLTPPGINRIVLSDVSMALKAGSALAVIGPSGSGKSSLVRAIVGVWTPASGSIMLDGAALNQWRPDDFGRNIGYLPQDVELFSGTIAENICRFSSSPDAGDIIAAARRADVHDLILKMPKGYDSMLGEGGANLSAGQRQRIALARALYGDPFLVVLDEPNSNLDSEGDQALTRAILGVRARNGVVVIVAHRPTVMAAVDLVAVVAEGRLQGIGPRDEIMAKLASLNPAPASTVRDVASQGA
jgi:PrtD family type I secretion system ABC transporter